MLCLFAIKFQHYLILCHHLEETEATAAVPNVKRRKKWDFAAEHVEHLQTE
jgi:hypothetical protein